MNEKEKAEQLNLLDDAVNFCILQTSLKEVKETLEEKLTWIKGILAGV